MSLDEEQPGPASTWQVKQRPREEACTRSQAKETRQGLPLLSRGQRTSPTFALLHPDSTPAWPGVLCGCSGALCTSCLQA